MVPFVVKSVADDDSASGVTDLEAVGRGLLGSFSNGLIVDDSVSTSLPDVAALEKDVSLDSDTRDVDTSSAGICEELRSEAV